MKRALLGAFGILVLMVLFAGIASPAHAQEPEPTPEPTVTPTPAYLQSVRLSSGNELIIERRITYGEIAVVVSTLILAALVIILAVMFIPRMYLK